jgi:putative glycerol-1-phosphate prenyltransferase
MYDKILKYKQLEKKLFAVLLDPEKCFGERLVSVAKNIEICQPDFVFIGGSQLQCSVDESVKVVKNYTNVPVVLFPGNSLQVTRRADVLLYLSLISGRNPDFLVGQHIKSAKMVKNSGLEIIPTGYILVNGGKVSAVEKATTTNALTDSRLIVSTAIAGELLGKRLVYLEAGSGAVQPVDKEIITSVKQNISIPLIVGGGLKSEQDLQNALKAGADLVVVGNYLENNPQKLADFVNFVKNY